MKQDPTVTAAQTALEAGEAALQAGDFRAADDALRGALAAAGPPLLRAAVLDALVRLGLDLGQDLAAERWLDECASLRTEHAGEISVEAGRSWALRARFRALARHDHKSAAQAWQHAARFLVGTERAIALHGLAAAV
ncbi:MAG: hypothetical protein GXP62_18160, partial [Oligoflexia bacterium]|nr:hypothetical protein [Oligoflexia bacterium]